MDEQVPQPGDLDEDIHDHWARDGPKEHLAAPAAVQSRRDDPYPLGE